MLYRMLYRFAERPNKRAVLLVDAGGEGVQLLTLAQSILLTVGAGAPLRILSPGPNPTPTGPQSSREEERTLVGRRGHTGTCTVPVVAKVIWYLNFRELRTGEVRRISLLGRW